MTLVKSYRKVFAEACSQYKKQLKHHSRMCNGNDPNFVKILSWMRILQLKRLRKELRDRLDEVEVKASVNRSARPRNG